MQRFTKITIALNVAAALIASVANAQAPTPTVPTERNIALDKVKDQLK